MQNSYAEQLLKFYSFLFYTGILLRKLEGIKTKDNGKSTGPETYKTMELLWKSQKKRSGRIHYR
jgi:hypothetical protein